MEGAMSGLRTETVTLPPALAGLLAEAFGVLDRDPAACRSALAEASALLALSAEPEPQAGVLEPRQRTRLERYVEAHLDEAVSLEDLAREIGLSSSYLCRAFRATFGVSPHAYLVQRRLDRARLLMTETPDPLAHIAQACGFSDQAHLCRQFGRRYGMPPNRWRTEQSAASAEEARP